MTDKPKHTPAPWYIHEEDDCRVLSPHRYGGRRTDTLICNTAADRDIPIEDARKHARYISAAPDMYRALVECRDFLEKSLANLRQLLSVTASRPDDHDPVHEPMLQEQSEQLFLIQAAIDKAEGEA